ncbi:hypothetical protein V6N13_143426 [Hibiscus sabdariffa]
MVPHSFCDYLVWNDNVFKGKSVDVTQLFSFREVLIEVVVQGQISVDINFHYRHCLGPVARCSFIDSAWCERSIELLEACDSGEFH